MFRLSPVNYLCALPIVNDKLGMVHQLIIVNERIISV